MKAVILDSLFTYKSSLWNNRQNWTVVCSKQYCTHVNFWFTFNERFAIIFEGFCQLIF